METSGWYFGIILKLAGVEAKRTEKTTDTSIIIEIIKID